MRSNEWRCRVAKILKRRERGERPRRAQRDCHESCVTSNGPEYEIAQAVSHRHHGFSGVGLARQDYRALSQAAARVRENGKDRAKERACRLNAVEIAGEGGPRNTGECASGIIGPSRVCGNKSKRGVWGPWCKGTRRVMPHLPTRRCKYEPCSVRPGGVLRSVLSSWF